MRIRELFENANPAFDENKFISKNQKGEHEPNFDLADDLVYYMNEDDEMYRRHVFPAVERALHSIKRKQQDNPSVFSQAVDECYKTYTQKFPIRYLPSVLDGKLKEEICSKLYDEVRKHHSEGKYKD